MNFNYFDIAIVAIVLITALIGFMLGLVWMVMFFVTLSVGVFLAIRFNGDIAQALPFQVGNEVVQTAIAAVLILLCVLLAGTIINFILRRLVKAIGLSSFDRILGTGLGIALGGFAITLLTMLLSLTELPDQDLWKTSKFIPKFQEFSVFVQERIPDDFTDIVNEKLGNKTSPSVEIPTELTPTDTSEDNSTDTTNPN